MEVTPAVQKELLYEDFMSHFPPYDHLKIFCQDFLTVLFCPGPLCAQRARTFWVAARFPPLTRTCSTKTNFWGCQGTNTCTILGMPRYRPCTSLGHAQVSTLHHSWKCQGTNPAPLLEMSRYQPCTTFRPAKV
jgi:hypothetical protein